jgi:hypothetical protein
MKKLLILLLLLPSFAWSNARQEYTEVALGGAFSVVAIVVVGYLGIILWKFIRHIYDKFNGTPSIESKREEDNESFNTSIKEQEIYQTINHELKNNIMDETLWTKAESESGGDIKKTRATYIKLKAFSIAQDMKGWDDPEYLNDKLSLIEKELNQTSEEINNRIEKLLDIIGNAIGENFSDDVRERLREEVKELVDDEDAKTSSSANDFKFLEEAINELYDEEFKFSEKQIEEMDSIETILTHHHNKRFRLKNDIDKLNNRLDDIDPIRIQKKIDELIRAKKKKNIKYFSIIIVLLIILNIYFDGKLYKFLLDFFMIS